MMNVSKAAAAAVRPQAISTNTVHLKLYPTPTSFSERREVLRVLERFGEVTFFKSLKYDPRRPVHNAFLATFNSTTSTQELIAASPLRYHLVSTTSSDPPTTDTSPAEPLTKSFEMNASQTTFSHTRYLNSFETNPLKWPYKPVNVNKSYIASALHDNIPDGMWSKGLKDWETDSLKGPTSLKGPMGDVDVGEEEDTRATLPRMRLQMKREKSIGGVMRGLGIRRKVTIEQKQDEASVVGALDSEKVNTAAKWKSMGGVE